MEPWQRSWQHHCHQPPRVCRRAADVPSTSCPSCQLGFCLCWCAGSWLCLMGSPHPSGWGNGATANKPSERCVIPELSIESFRTILADVKEVSSACKMCTCTCAVWSLYLSKEGDSRSADAGSCLLCHHRLWYTCPAQAEWHCSGAACSSAAGTASVEIQWLKLQPGWAPVK